VLVAYAHDADPEVFEKEVRALGVNRESQVVVYDKVGTFSSPGAWWMFKAMGHDAVVLDGRLPAGSRQGCPQNPMTCGYPGERLSTRGPSATRVVHTWEGRIFHRSLFRLPGATPTW
jgi:3-mercaptopyruvate sulfurtransferase SseA